jgi:hypothetical protein
LRVENAQLLNRVSGLERRRAGETHVGHRLESERR